MYWLIGSLVIVVMMSVLAVADSAMFPAHLLSVEISNDSAVFFLLVLLAVILIALNQKRIPSADSQPADKRLEDKRYSTQNIASQVFFRATGYARLSRHLSITILASGVVIGSVLQALIHYQQAEATAITEPMRVQALVTIEGISDSVYDGATDSGYRQVATISHLSPLVSAVTSQDLEAMRREHLVNKKNSLSVRDLDDNDVRKTSPKYRILLNAYPKNQSKPPSKTPSRRSQSINSSQFTRLNALRPGDQLFMSVALAPLATSEQALNNPSGFDSYRWLRSRHIDGTANILAMSTSIVTAEESSLSDDSYLQRVRTRIDQGRLQIRQHFYQDWAGQSIAAQQANAVTLSLLTGDRSLINRDTKDLYQLAGISHLLAISGTHVLFLAIILASASVLLFDRLLPAVYRYVPRWQVRWWVMIAAAFIYALFTGFDVPAARTAWTLLAIGLVRLTLLPISTMRVLLALAVLMAWYDPYVLWQAGYWLSFIAVALLLKYDDASRKYAQSTVTSTPAPTHKIKPITLLFHRVWITCKRVCKLQFWLFITLLPITLLLFGKASLWGLVINLFAIGLFGWVIVPLNLLAGLCYLLSPTMADYVWILVSTLIARLHELMAWLTSLPALSEAWLYTPVSTALLLIVLLGIVPWLLPRGLLSRWLSLPPLTLLVMTVYANQQSLMTTPTLYILPTGDRYISAALLQYPITDADIDGGQSPVPDAGETSVSWLFLSDHRPSSTRTMPTRLTPDTLAVILEQQLGRLSVDKLEGIIVQSHSIGLTDTLTPQRGTAQYTKPELLPMTVIQLNKRLPVSQYWQAGRFDRWSGLQQAYQMTHQALSSANISAQRCEQGKTWQQADGRLSIHAMTGWTQVDDASVWDCTIAIDSRLPIRVLRYDASAPHQSPPASVQTLIPAILPATERTDVLPSRLILNTDTHARVWQMWSLLCPAELPDDIGLSKHTTWLGHGTSHITPDVISHQAFNEIITYDDKPLEAALSMNALIDITDTEVTRP